MKQTANKYLEALNDLDKEEPSNRLEDRQILMSCINRPSYRKYRNVVGRLRKLQNDYAKLKHDYAMLLSEAGKYVKKI